MQTKVEDYVEAERAVGNPHWRIALRQIMPNVLPPLIVQTTLSIASAVIAEVSLSFLGLGQQPPLPIWVVCSTPPKTTWKRVVDGSVARCFDFFVGAFF
jgi:ABC-type dipeptide/oligopeptide/nickel transport system permease subunit